MTEQQFYEDPSRRIHLAELLADPVMQAAIEITRNREIGVQPIATVAVDLVQFWALTGAKRAGYLECLNDLLKMAEATSSKPPPEKPWEKPAEEIK